MSSLKSDNSTELFGQDSSCNQVSYQSVSPHWKVPYNMQYSLFLPPPLWAFKVHINKPEEMGIKSTIQVITAPFLKTSVQNSYQKMVSDTSHNLSRLEERILTSSFQQFAKYIDGGLSLVISSYKCLSRFFSTDIL